MSSEPDYQKESMSMWRYSLALTAVLAGMPLSAQDDSTGQDRGAKLYEAQLVRAGDLTGGLGSLGTAGKDPLRDGVVEVRGKRVVEVRLSGAAPVKSKGAVLLSASVAGARPGHWKRRNGSAASSDFKETVTVGLASSILLGARGRGRRAVCGGWMLDTVQSGRRLRTFKVSVAGAVKLLDT
jgi:hypothetical protein